MDYMIKEEFDIEQQINHDFSYKKKKIKNKYFYQKILLKFSPFIKFFKQNKIIFNILFFIIIILTLYFYLKRIKNLKIKNSLYNSKINELENKFEEINFKYMNLQNDYYKIQNELKAQKPINELLNSDIIKTYKEYESLKNLIEKNSIITFSLIYKTETHGDNANLFREISRNYSTFLLLVETQEGKRFGGFTVQGFRPKKFIEALLDTFGINRNYFTLDEKSFLFSFDKKERYVINTPKQALYSDEKYFAVFGNGDIIIKDKYLSNECESYFPKSYGNVNSNTVNDLTGSSKFNIKRIEVFFVNIINKKYFS